MPNRTTPTLLNVRVDDNTAEWLDQRQVRYMSGSKQMQARHDVALLRDVLTAEARRFPLTVSEARALAAVVGGPMIEHVVGNLLHHKAHDAFKLARQSGSSYAAAYGIDEDALLRRLDQMGPAQDLAVRDALSRWHTDGEAEAGLTITEP